MLTVSATDVSTGEAVRFGNAEITVDVLCASARLPFVFPACADRQAIFLGRRLIRQPAGGTAAATGSAERTGPGTGGASGYDAD